jgi:hypothetical protein
MSEEDGDDKVYKRRFGGIERSIPRLTGVTVCTFTYLMYPPLGSGPEDFIILVRNGPLDYCALAPGCPIRQV